MYFEPWFFMTALIPLAFLGGIVYLVVYLVRRRDNPNSPPIDWRRFGVGVSISFITPFFIGFATSAVFDVLAKTESLIMMVAMAAIFLIIGMVIAHHTVISSGLIIGSIIALVYAIGLNFETVPPAVMAILAGLGLTILIYFAYKKLQDKERLENLASGQNKEVK